MDRALWLLLRLRIKGWLRRFARSLRGVKGALLAVVGLGLLAPMFLTYLFMPREVLSHFAHADLARRFGPLFLLAYCVMSLTTTTSGERAITFSPPEVNLLFPAPFSQRALLVYKLIAALGACLVLTPFMDVLIAIHAPGTLPATIGILLGLAFVQLFAMAVGMATETIGVMAYNRRRKAVLIALGIAIAAAVAPAIQDIASASPLEALQRIEHSTATQVVLAPFRPFVFAFTAERIWPDLVLWAAVSLAIDVALVVFLFALDAQYLEQSAAASAKLYAQVERIRRSGGGGLLSVPRRVRRSPPMPPRWGGAGPIAWRQLTTARRDITRLVLMFILFMPLLVPLFVRPNPANAVAAQLISSMAPASMLFWSLFLTMFVPYDFRGDLERLAELKALPIAAHWLVLGQFLTPTLILDLFQWTFLALLAFRLPGAGPACLAVATLVPVANLLLVGTDNVLFLLFPFRFAGSNSIDFQAIGRAFLVMLAKFVTVALAAGIASLAGFVAYAVTGGSWPAALAAAWLVVAACAIAVIPIAGAAFRRFDVSADVPL